MCITCREVRFFSAHFIISIAFAYRALLLDYLRIQAWLYCLAEPWCDCAEGSSGTSWEPAWRCWIPGDWCCVSSPWGSRYPATFWVPRMPVSLATWHQLREPEGLEDIWEGPYRQFWGLSTNASVLGSGSSLDLSYVPESSPMLL